MTPGGLRRRGLDLASPFTAVLAPRLPAEALPTEDPAGEEGVRAAVARVRRAVQQVARGGFVLVVDDEDREDEGDLIMAAQHATPERVAFLLRHSSGVVCVGLSPQRCDELDLPLMVERGTEAMGTAFTVTVDAVAGTTTGISAADRAATLLALADPATGPQDLARPGHVFPLRARAGGVLRRPGHTEAAVDLARLAGLEPAGVLCEVVSADHSGMAGHAELGALAAEHDLPMLSIADLITYRRLTEQVVRPVSASRLPTRAGEFEVAVWESLVDGREHVVMTMGDVRGDDVLARLHSECFTGDVLDSVRCDCGDQLRRALDAIAAEGRGVLVYVRGHEGRGIGLAAKLAAYGLQDRGLDTVEANLELGMPADARDYGDAVAVLRALGASSVRLITNNPAKVAAVVEQGLPVERVPAPATLTTDNAGYLETKRARMGHLLPPPPH